MYTVQRDEQHCHGDHRQSGRDQCTADRESDVVCGECVEFKCYRDRDRLKLPVEKGCNSDRRCYQFYVHHTECGSRRCGYVYGRCYQQWSMCTGHGYEWECDSDHRQSSSDQRTADCEPDVVYDLGLEFECDDQWDGLKLSVEEERSRYSRSDCDQL